MQFEPGKSGNPKGRSPGPNKITRAMRERIADECDPFGFLASVMKGEAQSYTQDDEAMSHTPTLDQRLAAARTLAGKLCPDAKDRPITFDVGEINGPPDAMNAMRRVIEAMAEGSITPSEATSVMNVIGVYLDAWKTEDLEARITALEKSR